MLSSFGRIHALRLALLAVPAVMVCPMPSIAQEYEENYDYDDGYLGERPERYAMVRYMEGSIKINKWDYEEELTIGTPISEGDIIESNGRAVLQLGDGTRLAFGERTRLEIATLFDDRDGKIQALFRLAYGRVMVSVGPQSGANIRIDTTSGSASLGHRTNASLEAGTDRMVQVKVFSGNVAFSNRMDAIGIRGGERLTIYSDNERLNRVRSFNTYEQTGFEGWADRQLSHQPMASPHVPSEIRYYADTLNGHGDWVQVVDVGWCWRPRVTVTGWRPYWRGHWGSHRGGMTWISYDPFGYLTHHYGRWGWNSMHGWYWVPGVYYSPAWVAWHMTDSFFGWAPLGYYNHPVYWGYSGWRHDCWNVIDIRYLHHRNIYSYTRWDNSMRGRFPVYQPNRPVVAAWKRGPLIVTRKEFTNPNPVHIRAALSREVSSQRIRTYENQAGRAVVIRRDATARPSNTSDGLRNLGLRPFEDRDTRRVLAERSVTRQPVRGAESRDIGGRTPTRPSREGSSPGLGNRDFSQRNTSGDASREATGRRPDSRPTDSPPPVRNMEGREPSRTAQPNSTLGSREPLRTSPPNNTGDREPARTPPSSGGSTSREPTRTEAQPGRDVESRPSSPSRATQPSRSTSPSPSSPSRPSSPPPDRSRGSRR